MTTAAPRPWSRLRDREADSRRCAGDEGDPAGQRRRGRAQAELALLELPVLDAELLGVRDRLVRRERLGAAHDVDRVDVELARHARCLRVGAEAPHADSGDEHDRRIRAAHRRRSPASRSRRSSSGSRPGTGREARAAVRPAPRPGSQRAGRGAAAGPSCGGSGRDTRCRARRAVALLRRRGSRARRRSR